MTPSLHKTLAVVKKKSLKVQTLLRNLTNKAKYFARIFIGKLGKFRHTPPAKISNNDKIHLAIKTGSLDNAIQEFSLA